MRRKLAPLRAFTAVSIVPTLAVLTEVLWAQAWLVWVSGWQSLGWDGPPLSIPGAAFLALAAAAVTRGALARRWSLAKARVAAVGLLGIALALVVRVEIGGGYALWDMGWAGYASRHQPILGVGLIAGVYFLWRGIVIGRERLSFDTLYPRFLVGLTALVGLLVVRGVFAKTDDTGHSLAALSLYVVAFFVSGLLALALANVQSLNQEMSSHEAEAIPPRRWLVLFLGVLLAIVVVSVTVASMLSFEFVALLTRPLSTLADWLFIGFQYGVLLPLGLLASFLLYVLRFLVSLVNRGKPPEPFNPSDGSDWRKVFEGKVPQSVPPDVILALKWGLVALASAVVCVLLARALFRYRRATEEGESEEISESLWSWEVVKADLRALLLQVLRRFRYRPVAGQRMICPPVAVAQGDAARMLTVREIYQGLLWEGRAAGVPRRLSQTPLEYEVDLQAHVAKGIQDLRAITEAYVSDRYGDEESSPERLASVNLVWRRLRSILGLKATRE